MRISFFFLSKIADYIRVRIKFECGLFSSELGTFFTYVHFFAVSVCVRIYVLNTSKYRSQPIESIFRLNEAICLEFERSQTIYQMLRNKRIQVASLARKIKLK